VPHVTRTVRATYHLPHELVEEARDCVIELSGPPLHLTLSKLVATALRREIDDMKSQYHGGRDFPRGDRSVLGGQKARPEEPEEA
jgi:hypothetical protein